MASRQVLFLAVSAFAVAFLPAPTSTVDYMVGDAAGWSLKYPADWTVGKNFKLSDNLVFTYNRGAHTVVEVGGADFRACNISGEQIKSWDSGNDIVALDRTGRRWFFCSVANGTHCSQGMKLLVITTDGSAPAPAPTMTPPPPSSASFNYVGGAVAMAMAVAAAVLMF